MEVLESIENGKSWTNSQSNKQSNEYSVEKKRKKVDNPTCSGCSSIILDKFLISLNDTYWHKTCARCSICRDTLSESCFMLGDSKLFCREHYYKSQYVTRCAGCRGPMQTHEVAMRALQRVYHVTCFACSCCKQLLQRGDEFLLCRGLDFGHQDDLMQAGDLAEVDDGSGPGMVLVCKADYESGAYLVQQQQQQQQRQQGAQSGSNMSASSVPENSSDTDCPAPHKHARHAGSMSGLEYGGGGEQYKHQGGPGDGTGELDGSQQQHYKPGNAASAAAAAAAAAAATAAACLSYKRPRTTLSFEQKKRLMIFFKSCQNPSYKQRESLSEEMKLPPKVVQVWFQNQRAKVRQIKKLSTQMAAGCGMGVDEDGCPLHLHQQPQLPHDGVDADIDEDEEGGGERSIIKREEEENEEDDDGRDRERMIGGDGSGQSPYGGMMMMGAAAAARMNGDYKYVCDQDRVHPHDASSPSSGPISQVPPTYTPQTDSTCKSTNWSTTPGYHPSLPTDRPPSAYRSLSHHPWPGDPPMAAHTPLQIPLDDHVPASFIF